MQINEEIKSIGPKMNPPIIDSKPLLSLELVFDIDLTHKNDSKVNDHSYLNIKLGNKTEKVNLIVVDKLSPKIIVCIRDM